MSWIISNIGTIIAALLVALLIFFLVRSVLKPYVSRGKKGGKSGGSCQSGSSCSGCPYSNVCHPNLNSDSSVKKGE